MYLSASNKAAHTDYQLVATGIRKHLDMASYEFEILCYSQCIVSVVFGIFMRHSVLNVVSNQALDIF